MTLQDANDKMYKFELKDRLIKDKEFDGWKEIPLKQIVDKSATVDLASSEEKELMSLPGNLH